MIGTKVPFLGTSSFIITLCSSIYTTDSTGLQRNGRDMLLNEMHKARLFMTVNCRCAHNNEEYFSCGYCLLPIRGKTTLTMKLSVSNIGSSPFCCIVQLMASLINPRVSRSFVSKRHLSHATAKSLIDVVEYVGY